jgi:hypothetical protein
MLASEAVVRAYREAAIKPIGTVPNSEEYAEGLDRVNGFLDSLFGAEIGVLLTDVQVPLVQRTALEASASVNLPFPNNLTNLDQVGTPLESPGPAPAILAPNSRILWRGTTNTTLFFPQYPQDGARMAVVNTGASANLTLEGNGRRIAGANTAVRLPANPNITYFYRADLGEWIELTPLSLASRLPLPAEFNRLVICGTAISLTALDEIKPTSGTMFMYERLLRRAKERYFQREQVAQGGQYLVESIQSTDIGYAPLW